MYLLNNLALGFQTAATFQNLFYGLVAFIPNLVAALIIFLVGWLIGAGLGKVVAQVVHSVRVDQALRAAGVDRIVERAGFALNSGAFLGMLVKWFFIIVFLVAALDVLGLTEVTIFLRAVVLGGLDECVEFRNRLQEGIVRVGVEVGESFR